MAHAGQNESGPSPPGRPGRRRLSRRRKLGYTAICFLLFAGVAEGIARIADAVLHYRDAVVFTLDEGQVVAGPVPAQADIDLPPQTIAVRVPYRGPPSNRPYVVCGREVPGSVLGAELCSRRVTPEELAPAGTRRVFVVGESAAFGFPYRYEETFSARLDERLRPRSYAVYNAAVCAWTSGRIVPLARRIVDSFQPHTLVIFCGNNEWIHWAMDEVPYQHMLDESWASQRRLAVWRGLSHSRALAAMEYFAIQREARRQIDARRSHSPPKPGQPLTLTGSDYALSHPLEAYMSPTLDWWLQQRQTYLNVFEANLREMAGYAKSHGVRVILLTMPFNYKLNPAWACPQPESLDTAHRDAVRRNIRAAAGQIAARQYDAALPLLDETARLDPRPPVIHYLRGECLEALDRPREAEVAYAACREDMLGHLGCRLSVNETIRRVATSLGVELLDVLQVFDDATHAAGRWFAEGLLCDGCHPSPEGHRQIADALERAL